MSPPAGVLVAHAWRLVELGLVGVDEEPFDPAVTTEERLLRLLERGRGRTQAELALAGSRRAAPDDLGALGALAMALVAEEHGRLVFNHLPGCQEVARIVDPAVLTLAKRCALGRGDAELDPPIMRRGRDTFHEVTDRPMAELHVHLGGAVPTTLAWIGVVTQAIPTDQVFLFPEGPRTRWIEEWDLAIARAGGLLRMLANDPEPERRVLAEDMERLLLKPSADPSEAGGPPYPFQVERRRARRQELRVAREERRILEAVLSARDPGRTPLLLAYLRIRNAFHRALVQGVGGAGLHRFRRFYDRNQVTWRIAGAGTTPSQQRLGASLEEQRTYEVVDAYLSDSADGHPRGSAASLPRLDLELRIPPFVGRPGIELLRARARGVCRALEAWPDAPLRVGFIVHLLKSSARMNPIDAQERAVALVHFLVENPAWRPFVVGLDAAGAELAAPPRDYAPAFLDARRRADAHRPGRDEHPIRLGLTFHVGEDFCDLLTGVRHVDEAVRLLGMRAGDRIGHGLALAFPPGPWYHTRPDLQVPLADRLLDLLWAWRRLRAAGEPFEAVRAELSRLAVLGGSRLLYSDWESLAAALDREESEPTPDGVRTEARLLREMGIPGGMFETVLAEDRTLPTAPVVAAVQEIVRKELRRRRIVLELNPTSNTLVSGLVHMRDLPYLEVVPLDGAARRARGLRATLGADDPTVFQTSLREEYARLGSAFADPDSPRAAIEWLDELRTTGLDAVFIPRAVRPGAELARMLQAALDPGPRFP